MSHHDGTYHGPAIGDRPFRDRTDAGRELGSALRQMRAPHTSRGGENTIMAPSVADAPIVVVGLARGGLPVAAEVAAQLDATLDVLVVRKLGAPSRPEFAFGAIAEKSATFVDATTVASLRLSTEEIRLIRQREANELDRRIHSYRGSRPLVDVRGKDVVLVDDGLATGATMRAAVLFAKGGGAATITIAVPVGASETVDKLRAEADVVCLRTPKDFGAVGYWYTDFRPPSDDEIRALLR